MRSNIVAFIFARGGSKSVPRKNLRLLAGKPLMAYAIETAYQSTLINRVIVSTEDEEIATIARHYGADVPFSRPAELAQDDSPEWLAWQHAIRTMQTLEPERTIDIFVSLPPTSPLRSADDVDACIRLLQESEDTDLVITVREATRNPYFNMVTLDENGYAHLVIKPDKPIHRRQDAPKVYDMTTVAYAIHPGYILSHPNMKEARRKAIIVPPERAVDIDTELDFAFAEFLLTR